MSNDVFKAQKALIDYVSTYSGRTRMKIRERTSKTLNVSCATVDNIWSKRKPNLRESRKIVILLVDIVCCIGGGRSDIDEVVLYHLVMRYFGCIVPEEDARKETDCVFDMYCLAK